MDKPILRWGILDAANIARKNWKALWNSKNGRVTARDVGFYCVVQALLNGGRSDVIYDMLCQTNDPGTCTN